MSVNYKYGNIFVIISSFLLILYFIHSTPVHTSPQTIPIQILSMNDFHGQLNYTDYINQQPIGSASILASYLKQYRIKNSFLVHVGDLVGASPPISALLQDEPSIEMANQLHVDLATVGNHEFDEGIDELKRLINGGYHPSTGYFSGASFPYLVANVLDKKTRKPVFIPFLIRWKSGIPVGFIGVVTKDTVNLVKASGIKQLVFTDESEAINRQVKILRKRGVKTIIVLAHEGGQQNQKTHQIIGPITTIAKKIDPEVDVILAGHSHTELNGIVANKLIIEARSYGTAFASVKLLIDQRSKEVISKHAKIIPTFHTNTKPDTKMKQFVAKVEQKVNPIISQKIGQSKAEISRQENEAGESALGNLVADAHRWAMKSDFAFVNPGGIRASLRAGSITWGDLYTVQPFGNHLIKMELTGKQILQLLEQQFQNPTKKQILKSSGLTYQWRKNTLGQFHILNLKKTDGDAIQPNYLYTVTMNSFLAEGGDHFSIALAGKKRKTGSVDLHALIAYIQHLPQPIQAKIEKRIEQIQD
ncbi:5'-nucleotidase [Seinonella peptonophila]|uniref:5'-nucleotidase n=1 Tax=Seinonella peptonophila TaxID=112248 RepID=A0A1M4SN94_9BACL|nr:5'-nucleotidase C-terminal domain-containing protein [Seinonella peptonophila]SHE33703.1 5'-nucleotidase [Seinonella peptonophila]